MTFVLGLRVCSTKFCTTDKSPSTEYCSRSLILFYTSSDAMIHPFPIPLFANRPNIDTFPQKGG